MNWSDVVRTKQVGANTDLFIEHIANTFFGEGDKLSGTLPLIFTASGDSLSYYKINGATGKNGYGEIIGVGDYDTKTGLYKITVTVSGNQTDIYLSEPLYEGDYVEYPDKVVRNWKVLTLNGSELSNYNGFFGEKYANGEPVKIWLKLANPTEESIELPQIGTIDGENLLIVETTVQPPCMNIEL